MQLAEETKTTQQWEKRRLHHIFARDGRAVVVAMDGARGGPTPGVEYAARAVAQVVAGGVDAILTTFGFSPRGDL